MTGRAESNVVLERLAQELRRAHCSHKDAGAEEHVCVGECTIKRDGVHLDCKLCGKGEELIAPFEFESVAVRAIFAAVGIEWKSLTPEAQRAAVAAYQRGDRLR